MLAWLIGLVITALVVMLSFIWIDEPVAHFFDWLLGRPKILSDLGDTPSLFIPFGVLALGIITVRRVARRPAGKADTVLTQICISGILGQALKLPLKWLFGRTWPSSLLRHHVYGFFPMHHGPEYASFPSGHTAAVFAVLACLWIWYPAFRTVYVVMALLTTTGLVAANYHFVGDVVAGAFLGITTAMLAHEVWKLWRGRHPTWARPRAHRA
jgi:membrane-associated phospholipid phosphatase